MMWYAVTEDWSTPYQTLDPSANRIVLTDAEGLQY